MPSGVVKAWLPDRGFGFITEDGGDDVFVHAKQLPPALKTLNPGVRVRFKLRDTARGLQACDVVLEMPGDEPYELTETQFLAELVTMLPNIREIHQRRLLDWGKGHGWVT
jgi:cold shock CspA family protein